jgi:hypothetical protein
MPFKYGGILNEIYEIYGEKVYEGNISFYSSWVEF